MANPFPSRNNGFAAAPSAAECADKLEQMKAKATHGRFLIDKGFAAEIVAALRSASSTRQIGDEILHGLQEIGEWQKGGRTLVTQSVPSETKESREALARQGNHERGMTGKIIRVNEVETLVNRHGACQQRPYMQLLDLARRLLDQRDEARAALAEYEEKAAQTKADTDIESGE